jgi:hypothetical protein
MEAINKLQTLLKAGGYKGKGRRTGTPGNYKYEYGPAGGKEKKKEVKEKIVSSSQQKEEERKFFDFRDKVENEMKKLKFDDNSNTEEMEFSKTVKGKKIIVWQKHPAPDFSSSESSKKVYPEWKAGEAFGTQMPFSSIDELHRIIQNPKLKKAQTVEPWQLNLVKADRNIFG